MQLSSEKEAPALFKIRQAIVSFLVSTMAMLLQTDAAATYTVTNNNSIGLYVRIKFTQRKEKGPVYSDIFKGPIICVKSNWAYYCTVFTLWPSVTLGCASLERLIKKQVKLVEANKDFKKIKLYMTIL